MKFTWPLADHIITRGFAYLASIYVGGQHAALDLIRRTGTTRASPILAVASGTVMGVGWDMYSGFFVVINHAEGWRSTYRHLYGQSPVAVGQRVGQGQIIGNVGNTGWSLGDHLHFDLWNKTRQGSTDFYKNGWYAVNPELYLGQEPEEDEDMSRFIEAPDGKLYLTDGVFRNHIPEGGDRIKNAKLLFGEPVKVGKAFVADLRTSNPILSASAIKKLVKDAIQELVKS
jgi:hypothetical protein